MTEPQLKKISELLAMIAKEIGHLSGSLTLNRHNLLILADYLEDIGEIKKAQIVRDMPKNVFYKIRDSAYCIENVKQPLRKIIDNLANMGLDSLFPTFYYLEDLIWIYIEETEKYQNRFLPSRLFKEEKDE